MKDNNIFKVAAIGLGLAVVVLVIVLVNRGKQAADQIAQHQAKIATLSNQMDKITADLVENKQVVTNLETSLTMRQADIVLLSNTVVSATANLTNAQDEIVRQRDLIGKRDEAITKLESHNQMLEAQAAELNIVITNLSTKIDDIQQKLAVAEGDKAALTKELTRLTAEKAELERKFNDITVLRAQVAKIKHDINVARRLDRAAEGLPASSELKGGQVQMQGIKPLPPQPKHYDLNVEVKSDGSVKVIPPLNQTPAK